MSDSEDEGAFASADEGDSPTKSSPPTKGNRDDKNVKKSTGSSGKSTRPSGAATVDVGKKEPEKQKKQPAQGRQKNKGKAATKTAQSSPKKAASDPAQSPFKQAISDDVPGDQPPSPSKTKDEIKDIESVTEQPIASHDSPSKEPEKEADTGPSTAPISKDPTRVVKDDRDTGDQSASVASNRPATPEKSAQAGGGGGWGWGGWGSSLLSAATSSVQTFTHQIGDGITTIMDTVESSLDDLVTDDKEKAKNTSDADASLAENVKEPDCQKTNEAPKEKNKDDLQAKDSPEEEKPTPGTETQTSEDSTENFFASWGIANIAKKVTDTGKSLASKGQTLMTDGFDAVENLASGGIDVLENIGKKTYHTFSEHDPAFKKTREYLKSRGTKPNLSSVLREAKEQAEQEATQAKENEESRKVHFETQLDEYQGIAHLEALEMLSGQSEKKVLSLLNSLSSEDHKVIKPILISIKEVFEVEEEEDNNTADQDFSCLVNKHLSELKLGTSSDKLNKVHDMVKQWMADLEMQDSFNPKAIHEQAIQSLAELTSKGVEQFHKAGELVLMQRDSQTDCKERAHSFARLTGVLCHEAGNLATKFTDCLNKSATAENEGEKDVTTMITNIYLEASNSTTYIQDAFQLLLPILQQAAIEHMILARQS